MAPLITVAIADILNTVQRPGDFCTSGTVDIFSPRLVVEGVGPVALPLLPVQAEKLVFVAEQAPHGRGQETVVDTDVRRTWQIAADKVRIERRHWTEAIGVIVARVAEGLGLTDPVTAEFYKLLVYEEGGFFVSHRDTEKASAMFGTLVIVLPSVYEGGELVVRHQGREVRIVLNRSDPSEAAFAAFYADCRHEVLPITSGCRLTLVYNLIRQGRGEPPLAPRHDAEITHVTDLLRAWLDEGPAKVVYPLEHAYTPASLSFATLKGADAARSAVLTVAAEDADCDLHLALLSIEESGSAEHTGYYGSHRRGRDQDDDDEFEVIEICDRTTSLSDWYRSDGTRLGMGPFPFDETELSPPDALEDIKPDESEFTEATGNEGASFERTYRRAALVLWPKARRLAVLSQAGLAVSLPYLLDVVGRWETGGADRSSRLWDEAHELAGHMLASWPRGARHPSPRNEPGEETTMLLVLCRLVDSEHLNAFLADVSAAGIHGKGDNEAVVKALAFLPEERASDLVRRIIAGNAAAALSACGDLLARAAAGHALHLAPAAEMLLEALPGDPAQTPRVDLWERRPAMESGFVVDLLTALPIIDPALADRGVEHILSWPATYDPDAVLIPAALSLARWEFPSSERLRATCVNHLRTRVALPLEPPVDWVRAATLTCRCADCGELGSFLADPGRPAWTFKAAEARRRHMAETIRNSGCDLDTATERRGSPHGLICTKNRASFERRARQRVQDMENLTRLDMNGG